MHIELTKELLINAATIIVVLGSLLTIYLIRPSIMKWARLFLFCAIFSLYIAGLIPEQSLYVTVLFTLFTKYLLYPVLYLLNGKEKVDSA